MALLRFLLFLRLVINLVSVKAYVNPLTTTTGQRGKPIATTCGAVSQDDYGLLRGVDVTSSDYFTSSLKMDTVDDVEWLFERGLFWKAATIDAEKKNIATELYLEDLIKAMSNFKISDEVHDREQFYSFLEKIYEVKGNFLLVLGGKSVGKSLVLADFEKKLKDNPKYCPLLVNARRLPVRLCQPAFWKHTNLWRLFALKKVH